MDDPADRAEALFRFCVVVGRVLDSEEALNVLAEARIAASAIAREEVRDRILASINDLEKSMAEPAERRRAVDSFEVEPASILRGLLQRLGVLPNNTILAIATGNYGPTSSAS